MCESHAPAFDDAANSRGEPYQTVGMIRENARGQHGHRPGVGDVGGITNDATPNTRGTPCDTRSAHQTCATPNGAVQISLLLAPASDTRKHLMPGFMKPIYIVAACVMLAAPLTYQQCFDRYLRELQRINENEAYGLVNHWQAVSQRAAAWQAYQSCRDAAWEEWVRQWWRETMEAIQ